MTDVERYAVIGWPLGHTLSPAFQQAAFDALAIRATYVPAPTPPEHLAGRVAEARAGAWRGLNVTIPHKIAIAGMLDTLTPAAQRLGAVNTVMPEAGGLTGDNTDGEGFLRALRDAGGFDPSQRRAVVVGAGGAGRAVVWALADAGTASITVVNRHLTRAADLASVVGAQTTCVVTGIGLDDPRLRATVQAADLLVNATSVGMAGGAAPKAVPLPAEWMHPRLLVYDIVYRPAETPLLATARQIGAATLGGLEMLVYQGAASFERWTNRPAPVAAMMQAARCALAADVSTAKDP